MIRTVQDMRRMSEVIQVTSADIDKLGQQTDRIAGIVSRAEAGAADVYGIGTVQDGFAGNADIAGRTEQFEMMRG